jgi:predicted lipase
MDALRSPVDRNNNSVKQKSLMKNYYSSWEDLLEKSEIAERSNLARRRHYGSTESINSSGSEGSRQNPAVYAYQKQQERELMQAAGHHLQLHAVHNQTYQTSSSALETCPELDESDASVQMFDDLPRRGNAAAASLKKSNSRVCSSGKLCLRVESFSEKQRNNTSATQTETVQRRTSAADSGKYVGLYQKSPSR